MVALNTTSLISTFTSGVEQQSNNQAVSCQLPINEAAKYNKQAVGRQNIPIKTKDFSKDENQNHADKDSRLLHVCADALVADNANAVSGSKTRHSDGQAARKMHEATAEYREKLENCKKVRVFNHREDERKKRVAL